MSGLRFSRDIALPVGVATAIVAIGMGLGGGVTLLAGTLAPNRAQAAEVVETVDRYAIATPGPSAITILDTATGRVRTCATAATGTPTCGDWSTD